MNYTVVTDDTFNRANTSVGTAANSTNVTGPTTYASPSTGGNYVDRIGTLWSIAADQLTATYGTVTASIGNPLVRPASEALLNVRVTATVNAGASGCAPGPVARWSNNQGYAAYYFYGPTGGTPYRFGLVAFNGSITTTLSSSVASAIANITAPVVITLTATGANPTQLTATLALASAPGTILATLTASDSTSALQVAGQCGVTTNFANNNAGATFALPLFSEVKTEQAGTASNITITPASAAIGQGGQQTFTVSTDGIVPTGTNVTVNLATTIGSLSASSVTLTGNNGIPTATVTLTAPGSLGSGSLTGTHTVSGGTLTLSDFASVPITVTYAPLTVGTLGATASHSSITLAATSGLSGGSGVGYQYAIYRGTDPNFTANSGSLLATVSSLPYVDSTAVVGTEYYYGIIGSDNASNSVDLVPAGLGTLTSSTLLYVAASLNALDLCLVGIGDSITYGATMPSNAGTVLSPTAMFYAMQTIQRMFGFRNVYGSNQGVSGKTTFDWRPSGTYYPAAKSAMNTLISSAITGATQVFQIMLGTNDSASSGTNNGNSATGATISGALTPAQYVANMVTLINQLLTDFPSAKIVVHLAPYYTPNTYNSSVYEQTGLSVLWSYRTPLIAAISAFGQTNPGHVFLGDTTAWDYFKANYLNEQTAESGNNGTFYLHPSSTAAANGNIGTQSIGKMWGNAIVNALLAPPVQVGPTYYRNHL